MLTKEDRQAAGFIWDDFKLATGSTKEFNIKVARLIDLFIEYSRDIPNTLVVGEELIKNLEPKWNESTRYWGGWVGELRIVRVPGDDLLVTFDPSLGE